MSRFEGTAGDIWSTGAFSFESPLKDLLDSGGYTLEQLLAEDELLQEMRGMHPQLLAFFSREEAMAGLIRYLIQAPPATGAGKVDEKEVVHNTPSKPLHPSGDENYASMSLLDVEETIMEAEEEKETPELERSIPPGQWLFQKDEPEKKAKPAEQDQYDLKYIRFPFLACEVICCEINVIIDTLVNGKVPIENSNEDDHIVIEDDDDGGAEKKDSSPKEEEEKDEKPPQMSLLDLLFSLLTDTEIGQLDDRRAGYFDKVLSVLLRRRPYIMVNYLNDGGGRGQTALMSAFFNHMYSHSIMQVLQRLLMPQPPELAKQQQLDEEEKEGEWPMDHVDDDEEDNIVTKCTWSSSPYAIDLLLLKLVGPETANEDEEEALVDASQNASEVLITVIQNSPLTSPTLVTLTTDPVLKKITDSAVAIKEGREFSIHESRLTCAMSVLESLILQLGGYGAVGAMGEEDAAVEDDGSLDENNMAKRQIAEPKTLVQHLPDLLSSLANLLRAEEAKTWTSPMQFDEAEPKKLLGTSRLRIVRLLESLVLLGNSKVDDILCQSECLAMCLDLFWEFEWCSMLHQSVANLLVHVFEGANSRAALQEYFIVRYDLLRRLMDSFEVTRTIGTRLTRIEPDKMENVPTSTPDNGVSSIDGEHGSASSIDEQFEKPEEISVSTEEADVTEAVEEPEATSKDKSEQHDGDVERPVTEEREPHTLDSEEDESKETEIVEDAVVEKKEGEEPTNGTKIEEQSESTAKVESTESGAAAAAESAVTALNPPSVSNEVPFRMGYMGHVIIICQALVHVCTTAAENGERFGMESVHLGTNGESPAIEGEEKGASSGVSQKTYPLRILHLIQNHPLQEKWQEFVTTTLAEETAIQSTPLGGYQDPPQPETPMHAQTVIMEDAEPLEDQGAISTTARGLLVDSGVIDMDDTDLDIAASMMEALNIPGRSRENREVAKQGAPSVGIEMVSMGTRQSNEYLYDDPLGRGRIFEDDDSDEDGEEEYPPSGGTGKGDDDGVDPPVIDLFAGNFSFNNFRADGGEAAPQVSAESGDPTEWSNFANFDDAFASASGENAEPSPSADKEEEHENPASEKEGQAVDEIFATIPSAAELLLAEEATDKPEKGEPVVVKDVEPVEDTEPVDDVEPVEDTQPLEKKDPVLENEGPPVAENVDETTEENEQPESERVKPEVEEEESSSDEE